MRSNVSDGVSTPSPLCFILLSTFPFGQIYCILIHIHSLFLYLLSLFFPVLSPFLPQFSMYIKRSKWHSEKLIYRRDHSNFNNCYYSDKFFWQDSTVSLFSMTSCEMLPSSFHLHPSISSLKEILSHLFLHQSSGQLYQFQRTGSQQPSGQLYQFQRSLWVVHFPILHGKVSFSTHLYSFLAPESFHSARNLIPVWLGMIGKLSTVSSM